MGDNPAHPNQWQQVSVDKLDGPQKLKQIRDGRLHVTLENIAAQDGFCDRLYDELAECIPGLHTSDQAADLVLASAHAMTYFNVDPQPCVHWQLRGSQKIISYPPTAQFIEPGCIEEILLDGCNAGLYYEPRFEESAKQHTIGSGQMVSLPYPTPYRSEFEGDLSVCLVTRHHTLQSKRRLNIAAANRVMQRVLPVECTQPVQTGAFAAIKNICSDALSLASRFSRRELEIAPDLPVTTNSPSSSKVDGGKTDGDNRDAAKKNQNIAEHLIVPSTTTYNHFVSEN